MTKSPAAALGFRVKSGWAAVVLLTGTTQSPRLLDVERVELCDSRLPETRQPYHATMGKLETDPAKVNRRERVVRCIARQSMTTLLVGYRQHGYHVKQAGLVVGSQIEPATIANPHIRAHSLEGRLFRDVIQESLRQEGVRTDILVERDAYASVAGRLEQSTDEIKRIIQNLGRVIPRSNSPWRAEQKLACLAALFVLKQA